MGRKRNLNLIIPDNINNSNDSNDININNDNDINKKKKNKNKNKKIIEKELIIINKEIKTLDDLIEIGDNYDQSKNYNINIKKIIDILPLLKKLNNIIGMSEVKKTIIGQIIYFLQDLQNKNEDMMHTVIQGPPGVGKTLLGHVIGEIYWKLDIIQSPNIYNQSEYNNCEDNNCENNNCENDNCENDDDYDDKDKTNNLNDFRDIIKQYTRTFTRSRKINKEIKPEFKFKIVKRSDLIGKYLGHTAIKTQEVINSALGGVLFIDEAYSLGNGDGKDSFAKECIDTINQNLTEKKNQLLVIIAGYKDALDTCFFSFNEGLNRRFPFRYTIDNYNHEELAKIFIKMIGEINLNLPWSVNISDIELISFFKENYEFFPNFGGDIETFLLSVKIQHGIRVFCLDEQFKKKIILDDLNNALKVYKLNRQIKDNSIQNYLMSTLYV